MKLEQQHLVDDASAVPEAAKNAFFVLDRSAVEGNASGFARDFPLVEPMFEVETSFSAAVLDVASTFVTSFGCNNKPELDLALRSSADPTKVEFLAPTKPASQVRRALGLGIRTFGCGSVSEVGKVHRAAAAAGASPMLMVSVDASTSADDVTEIIGAATGLRLDVVGVALCHGQSRDRHKPLAVSRLAFETGRSLGHPMKRLNVGRFLDGDLIASQFASYDGELEVVAFVGRRLLRKSSIRLMVKIVDQRRRSDGRQVVVVGESVYGAFRGALAASSPPDLPRPKLIRAKGDVPASATTCDVYGDSGDDLDVIASGAAVSGGNVAAAGDWLLFSDLDAFGFGSNLPTLLIKRRHRFWASGTDDDARLESSVSRLEEAAFALPDLAEDILEQMLDRVV